MKKILLLLLLAAAVPAAAQEPAPAAGSAASAAASPAASLKASPQPSPAQTAPVEPEPLVSLDGLVARALQRNREILAAQKQFEAAKTRPTQDSSLPDPMLSFGYRNMGNPLPFTSIGSDPNANAGLSVVQELPFPGKLKLRGQMAQQEANAAFQEYLAAELRTVARLKQAFYQLHLVYTSVDIIRRNKDLLEKFTTIAESRYSVGKGQQQDVLKAQVELTILLQRLRKLEQEKQSLKAEINALLDRGPEAPLGRPAQYRKAELAVPLDDLYRRVAERAPLLRKEQFLVEKNQLGLDLVRRDYYPDFSLMGGYYNAGPYPSMYELRFDVKVPVFFWRKQRAAVAERSSNLSAARHQYAGTEQMLRAGVKDAYALAQASDELAKLYSGAILPQAMLALESSIASYQVGAVDFLTLITNFRTVLDYEVMYQEEVAAFQKALARLEELTGASLT